MRRQQTPTSQAPASQGNKPPQQGVRITLKSIELSDNALRIIHHIFITVGIVICLVLITTAVLIYLSPSPSAATELINQLINQTPIKP